MSDCLFCQIVAGQVPAKVAAESDNSLAFYDIAPQAPVHVLVVPKRHFDGVNEVTPKFPEVFDDLMLLTRKSPGLRASGKAATDSVFNSGDDGRQTVNHLHVHVLGGRRMTWPPG